MSRLDLGWGDTMANSYTVDGSFCIFWLVLPPTVHSHDVPFHSLSGSIIQFQVLKPRLVFGVTERFDHVVFQPRVVASWADQQLGRVKGCRSLSLESCCKRRLYSRLNRLAFRCWCWSFCLRISSSRGLGLVCCRLKCCQSCFKFSNFVLGTGICLDGRGPSLKLVSNLFCQTLDSFSFLQCMAILESFVLCQFVKVNATGAEL